MRIRDMFRAAGLPIGAVDGNLPPFGGEDGSGATIVTFTPRLVEMLRLAGAGFPLSELYRTQPAVRICVDFIATNEAHLRTKTYQRTDDSPQYVRDHALNLLLESPNPRCTGYDLRRGTASDKEIYDTAYWWKVRANPGDAPERLYRVPPSMVIPKGGDIFTGPAYYDITGPNGTFSVDPADMIDFSGYNPVDTRVGSSPLEALRAVLNEDMESGLWREHYWKNAARREGIIERPADAPEWDDTGRDRFRLDWANRSAGAANSGVTSILEDDMHWVPDSFSPKDSEYIVGREFTLDMVATTYNIPLAMLSRKGAATFASMKEFRTILYVDVLGSRNASYESTINAQLVPDFGDPDLYVETNIAEKLQGDFESTADAFRSHVQVPDLAVNESRRIQNLPSIGDPDDEDNPYNFPAMPSNYTYKGQPAPSVPSAQPAQSAEPAHMRRAAIATPNGHDRDKDAQLSDELLAFMEEQ